MAQRCAELFLGHVVFVDQQIFQIGTSLWRLRDGLTQFGLGEAVCNQEVIERAEFDCILGGF